MAKPKIIYRCTACGYESAKWNGKCPSCGSWNTLEEDVPLPTQAVGNNRRKPVDLSDKIQELEEVDTTADVRYHTGVGELDRVLGGGLVRGSIVLLGGEPGIGKSTLLLQICQYFGKEHTVLYVSGEESAKQIKLRAERLGVTTKNLAAVGDNCFRSCGLLAELEIPVTLQKIGLDAFCDTAWLKNQQTENPLVQVNHILIDATTCSGTAVEVPDGVTEIGNFAFYNCGNLQKIMLPASVTKIDWGAFWQCSGLETLTVQGNLAKIGESAFSDCTKLSAVYTVMSEDEWSNVQIESGNELLEQATIHYNSILEELLLADLDNNGSVDSTDVFYILLGVAQNAVGMDSGWTPAQEKAADIDGSGAVDSTDVFYVLLYIARNSAGIPTTWEMLVA